MGQKYLPTERHLKAAQLYLAGGRRTRGNWAASCSEAGFSRIPSKDTIVVKKAFETVQDRGLLVDQESSELAQLIEQGASWDQVVPLARKALLQVASGDLRASPGQVQALKEIIARAEGKVGMVPQDERPIGILVLPALVAADGEPWMGADPEEGDEIFELHKAHQAKVGKAAHRERVRAEMAAKGEGPNA